MSNKCGSHVMIIPYPATGHVIPILDLTTLLLSRGLTITMVVEPTTILPLLEPLLSTHHPSFHSLLLPIPPIPTTTPFRPIVVTRAYHNHFHLIHQWFHSHPSPPLALIADVVLGGLHILAAHLHIPRVTFSASGAFEFCLTHVLWRQLFPPVHDHLDNDEISFPMIPGSPKYPWWQVSDFYRSFNHGDPDWELYKDSLHSIGESSSIIINTFSNLEAPYLDYLNTQFRHPTPLLYALGPLHLANPHHSHHHLLTWLDGKQDGSVVYVSFGSRVMLADKEMHDLAVALEASGVHFLWRAKENNVPDGFEERVKGRGIVVREWCPQVAILSHRAVGSFLTHCGFNSVLEGVGAGVVMLAWPICSDQFTNAKLVVDELGLGVRVCGEAVTELTRLLAESVKECRLEKERVRRIHDLCLNAVKQGGTSHAALDAFLNYLNKLTSTINDAQ